MKLSDVSKRFQAPLPAREIHWKPASFNRERTRALLLAHIDARAVQDRLDTVCPDDWHFEMEIVTGAARPTVKGRLVILGVVREDIGEAGEPGTFKAAASDALKRCAVQFGIGRYLYDLPKTWDEWDDTKRAPVRIPELPQWALPDHERSPGGMHLVQALEQLKYELPDDMGVQREIYKHLKAALQSLHPVASHG
ncbi:single-stranded DNA-binding protein DdrA [Deinococcus rubellus]|uniref:Rad52/Rad22 family DNA repair protein n=1 Tax=Deinococcus rubellus TaxID=1889240 RepID=A0ABY5YL03_9DEIO|nr:Rad52/Rad22 family DNA repair protein [Deinococcus rubellus]UWX64782.1 Rad52/Rad22 family DNA repair protein [Deinococcus rubellus]